jgi:hypothetical protein
VQFSADGHAKSTTLFLQSWQHFQLLLSLMKRINSRVVEPAEDTMQGFLFLLLKDG